MTGWMQDLMVPVNIADDDSLTRLRLHFVRGFAGATTVAALIGILSQIAVGADIGSILITGIVLVLGTVMLVLVQQRKLGMAALLLLTALVAVTLILNADMQYYFYIFMLLGVLTLFAAATLVSGRTYVIINVLVFARGIMLLRGFREGLSGEALVESLVEPVIILVTMLIVSFAARYVVEQMRRTVRGIQRNNDMLIATAEVAQATAQMLDLDELFARSVELIRDYFGFYHVQVFRVDERGEYATLAASTGEVGKMLMSRRHRLPVGSVSVIGRVTYFGDPVIAADTELDPLHRPNDLLPDTRSEMAVAIRDGDRIIGALDAQSTQPNAFAPADVQVLQTLADLLAAAIRNAQVFREREQAIAEQKRLVEMADTNVREIQRLNQQLTRAGWAQFLEQRQTPAGVTLRDGSLKTDGQWSDALVDAAQAGRPVVTATNGRPGVVAVPMILRGEVIGAIEVEPDTALNPGDVITVVEAIAQRLALGLDNARLFEEAHQATAQEQRINAIVTRYQSVASVDDLLRITITELSETLGARRGAIRLGSGTPSAPDNGDTAS